MLPRASVFLGGFTAAALEAVVDAPAGPQLDELLEASLVRRRARTEAVRAARARARIRARGAAWDGGEAAEARARHRRYFAALTVESTSDGFDEGGSPGELAAPLLADHANLARRSRTRSTPSDPRRPSRSRSGCGRCGSRACSARRARSSSSGCSSASRSSRRQEIALMRAVRVPRLHADGEGVAPPARRARGRGRRSGGARDRDREPVRAGAQRPRSSRRWRRLRPELLALVDARTSPKGLGWIQYFLALDAYVDGRYEAAAEHAAVSVEKARESGHEFMLASAVATGLLAQLGTGRRDPAGPTWPRPSQLMRRPGVPPLVAFALWFVARYAAGVDPSASGRWLAHAARIVESLDSDLWPRACCARRR